MNVDDSIQVFEEFNISVPLLNGVNEPRTKHEGHHFSDYVLLRKERKAFAAVEAKKNQLLMRISIKSKQNKIAIVFKMKKAVNYLFSIT